MPILLAPDGTATNVPDEEVQTYLGRGYVPPRTSVQTDAGTELTTINPFLAQTARPVANLPRQAQMGQEAYDKSFEDEGLAAFGEGLARGATAGLVNLGDVYSEDRARVNPLASGAGEIAGIAGGALVPFGGAGRLAARAGEGAASALGGGVVRRMATEAAVDSLTYSTMQQGVREVRGDAPFSAEAVLSDAMIGGGVGAGLGVAFKGASKLASVLPERRAVSIVDEVIDPTPGVRKVDLDAAPVDRPRFKPELPEAIKAEARAQADYHAELEKWWDTTARDLTKFELHPRWPEIRDAWQELRLARREFNGKLGLKELRTEGFRSEVGAGTGIRNTAVARQGQDYQKLFERLYKNATAEQFEETAALMARMDDLTRKLDDMVDEFRAPVEDLDPDSLAARVRAVDEGPLPYAHGKTDDIAGIDYPAPVAPEQLPLDPPPTQGTLDLNAQPPRPDMTAGSGMSRTLPGREPAATTPDLPEAPQLALLGNWAKVRRGEKLPPQPLTEQLAMPEFGQTAMDFPTPTPEPTTAPAARGYEGGAARPISDILEDVRSNKKLAMDELEQLGRNEQDVILSMLTKSQLSDLKAQSAGRGRRVFPRQITSERFGSALPSGSRVEEARFFDDFLRQNMPEPPRAASKRRPQEMRPSTLPDLTEHFTRGTEGWSQRSRNLLGTGLVKLVAWGTFPGVMAAAELVNRYGKTIAKAAADAIANPTVRRVATAPVKLDWDVLNPDEAPPTPELHNLYVLQKIRHSPQAMRDAVDEATASVRLSDPESADLAAEKAERQLDWLASQLPPSLSPFGYRVPRSSVATINELVQVLVDPVSVLSNIGTATANQMRAIPQLWPELWTRFQMEAATQVAELQASGKSPPRHISKVVPGLLPQDTQAGLAALQNPVTTAEPRTTKPVDARVVEGKTTAQLLAETRADTPR